MGKTSSPFPFLAGDAAEKHIHTGESPIIPARDGYHAGHKTVDVTKGDPW